MDISPRSRVCRWIWEVLFRPWRWRSPQTNASVDPEAPGVDPDVDIEECLAAGHPDQDPQPDQEDPQPDQDAEYADNGDDEDWAEYDDDDEEEDGGQIDPNSIDSTVDATNQPYNREQEEQIREERGYGPRDGATSKRVVEKFLVTPVMAELLEILRNIYRDHPDDCPIEVILLVFMYEYIEYGGIDPDKLNVDDIKKFIEYIRSRWAEVGSHVNLGNVPTGGVTHILLAFATKECMDNDDGTDAVDKAFLENHTLKYMLRNILRDYLFRIGHEATQDEAQALFREKDYTVSDAGTECGFLGNGNKQAVYLKQLKARFRIFCKRFKDRLIIDRGMEIDGKRYTQYEGIHISALVGLLDVILRALLTKAKTNEPLRLLIHSKRIRHLFFNVKPGTHEFDVLTTVWLIICPFVHPNYHQIWLSKLDRPSIKKLDLSYSTAFEPLSIATVGEVRISDASEERVRMRDGVRGADDEVTLELTILRELKAVKKEVKKVGKRQEKWSGRRTERKAEREAKRANTGGSRLDRVLAKMNR